MNAPPPVAPAPPSLRARLLRHVLLPLALIWLMGTVASALMAKANAATKLAALQPKDETQAPAEDASATLPPQAAPQAAAATAS